MPASTDFDLSAIGEAEAVLAELAGVFFQAAEDGSSTAPAGREPGPSLEARYRVLLDQIPAVVFMAYLDQGIGEAYVSPQIEASLGFTQKEWLEDPVLWYRQVHPDDKGRWSNEAAEMFLSGKALRSAYRVLARDGRVVWFQCEARLVRRDNGEPWFIHGVGFDITELQQAQEALQDERNLVSAIFDTVGALVIVLDREGRIVRFNRACERMTGYSLNESAGACIWDLLVAPAEAAEFRALFFQIRDRVTRTEYESGWVTRDGTEKIIAWSAAVLPGAKQTPTYIIVSGTDVTEQRRLEKTVLEIRENERRRIGQDLHDGLGQHLTGVAFMGKVLEQRLADLPVAEAADAAKIVQLVNESIKMTRELARGLLPVASEAEGLMSALERWAGEVSELYHVACRFECCDSVFVRDEARADHLYRLAQEAVTNAIRHGRAKNIAVGLAAVTGGGVLTVRDDGCGFDVAVKSGSGLGLRIMHYRAKIIGGSLSVQSSPHDGTLVKCVFRIADRIAGEPDAG